MHRALQWGLRIQRLVRYCPCFGGAENILGDQVNKKEQNITGVIGELHRVRGMEDTEQCGEYGLGEGEGCLEARPWS